MFLQKVFKLCVLLILSFLLLSCNSLGKSEYENLISEKEQYFTFDPITSMKAINQGNEKSLFVLRAPFANQDEMWLLPEEKTVYWEQDDYFRIAQVLNEDIGNGLSKGLNVQMFFLENDCMDTGLGFTRGNFTFFKVDQSDKQGTRTVITIDIQPWRKIIRTYKAVYSPIVENWGRLDLQKIKVSARQALDIAEKNGGSDARGRVANKCLVSVSMFARDSEYDGWDVRYTTSDEKSGINTIYEVYVDPQNGKSTLISIP